MSQKGDKHYHLWIYEYKHGLEKLNQISLPKKDDFHSHLNMEDITDADYAHKKKSLEILKKRSRRTSWLVCSKGYIIVRWCIWEIPKYVS